LRRDSKIRAKKLEPHQQYGPIKNEQNQTQTKRYNGKEKTFRRKKSTRRDGDLQCFKAQELKIDIRFRRRRDKRKKGTGNVGTGQLIQKKTKFGLLDEENIRVGRFTEKKKPSGITILEEK